MEKNTYDNGIEFNKEGDYLGEQIKKISDRPFAYYTISALKAELLQALNAHDDARANLITKELQSRTQGDETFTDRNLGANDRKHVSRLNKQ